MRKDFQLPDEPDFSEEPSHPVIPPVRPGRIGGSIPHNGEHRTKDAAAESDFKEAKRAEAENNLPDEIPVLQKKQMPDPAMRKGGTGAGEGGGVPSSLAYTAGSRRPIPQSRELRPAGEAALPPERLARFQEDRDAFFSRAARRTRAIKFIVLILLILYILSNLLLYGDSISYENARLLLYDFQNAAQTIHSDAVSTIRIGSDTDRRFSVFRGEFCVAGQSGLALYRSNGRQILDDTHYLYSPSLAGSEHYQILYDRGHNRYYVYNSYALVYEGESEYPISSMSCADDGSYLIQTRTREYRSAIEVYSAKFKLRSQIRTQSLVMVSALSPDGDLAVTASVEAAGSSYMTVLTGYDASRAETLFRISLADTFPLSISFSENTVILVGSDAIYSIGNDGKQTGKYEYGDASLSKFKSKNGNTALVLSDGSSLNERVVLLDEKGGIVYETALDDSAVDLDFSEKFLLLLGESSVFRLSLSDGKTEFVSCDWGGTGVLAYSDSISAVIYADTIKCIRFE